VIQCSFEDGGKASLRHVTVDVLVLKNDKILLVKRANHLLEGGKWGLVGGFVDRDENLTDAAQREIDEETGYKVKDIKLLTINGNPDRPSEDRQNVAFVFYCTALNQESESDDEVQEQKWFSFDALPSEDEIAFDHSLNIKVYLGYLKTGELPVPNI
jgi:8-oxo-dGTP diphosphatase